MRITITLSCLLCFALFQQTVVHGQAKAQPCFFGADFDDGVLPSGWDIGPLVERRTPEGIGLGEFVPAWTVGDAEQANAGGFFPVPNVPAGNRFAMANDDAPPCNCDMQEVSLTTPPIDLSGRSGTALECRVFHEQTLGGGPAYVEASMDGNNWITMALVPVQSGAWRSLVVNLSAFDGQSSVRLRFRWSDNGQWASGFAVDDICLRERLAYDLSVVRTHTHDPSASPFTVNDQSLRYRLLPLEQAGPMTVAVEVINRGMQPMPGVNATAIINQGGVDHGPFAGVAIPLLVPGESAILPISTGWTPTSTGTVTVSITVAGDVADMDPSDNGGSADLRITGPGWEDGYGAMARDEDMPDGLVGGEEVFISGNRVELVNAGSTISGISAVLGVATAEGTIIRAILMDVNMALVDTSVRHVITLEDLDRIQVGEARFLPMAHPAPLPAGDYFVGMQRLNDENDGTVHVLVSGIGPVGGSILMEGETFLLSYPLFTPMVRAHFNDYGVGVNEALSTIPAGPHVFPVPMRDQGWMTFEMEKPAMVAYRIIDTQGRTISTVDLGKLPSGPQRIAMDVSSLAPGTYLLSLTQDKWVNTRVFVVEGR